MNHFTMKQLLFLFSLTCSILFANAQTDPFPHWTLKHREAILLSAYTESDSANVVNVSGKDFRQGRYTFLYEGVNKDSGLVRTIIIVDASDKELYRTNGSALSFSAKGFKKIVRKNGTVRIYTMAVPADPAKAAVVRVRRIHLCTIKYQ